MFIGLCIDFRVVAELSTIASMLGIDVRRNSGHLLGELPCGIREIKFLKIITIDLYCNFEFTI